MNFDMLSHLTPQTARRVRELDRVCAAYDGTDRALFLDNSINCYQDMPCYFLAWEGNQLLGAMSVCAPRPYTGTASVCVRPEHRRRRVMQQLIDHARNVLSWKGYQRILFACNADSPHGNAACRHSGLPLDHREYLMRYGGGHGRPGDRQLRIRLGEPEDVIEIGNIYTRLYGAAGFLYRDVARSVLRRSELRCYTAWLGGELVGACSVNTEGEHIGLFGPVVDPERQGKGYGKALLETVLDDVSTRFAKPILLEIESDNQPALNLYTTSGFTVQSQYDYYAYDLEDSFL